ncbi:NB-ARC domain-containing protein [uncultured Treponema sp.]|uniref:NB-ARC domain-containing protein n=1 Tax=uncultured Treponema sp. TaxID=162155 RepID=UPI0025FED9A7|nr:NB-ARC domain-containing protein [uncultured Treponema sp.]
MDYFTKKIDQKIALAKNLENYSELKILLQVKIEYALLFMLSLLRNRNFGSLKIEEQEYINRLLVKPSVGDLAQVITKLNISNDKNTKKIVNAISKYPELRNVSIGHGFTFEDGNQNFIKKFEDLSSVIYDGVIMSSDYDYIFVLDKKDSFYLGINFSYNDGMISWKCPVSNFSFQKESTYILASDNNYFFTMPYIWINNNEELYLYSKIVDPLLGRILYNQIFTTRQITKDWDSLEDISLITDDIGRKICVNKTIVNDFKRNYTKYFEVGIKDKIKEFLEKDKSTVSCTIWGHGGVGKTAVIQSIIEEYENSERKIFDYIVFLSAKDRLYNYKNGKIEEIRERIDSFSDIIFKINEVIGSDLNTIDSIVSINGKILIVIDDLETFNKSEVEKIQCFIKKLDINKHKVVLTTRTNLIIGQEIKTNELNISETQVFLSNIFTHDIKDTSMLTSIQKDKIFLERIQKLTS